jgi:hypothetical protein
VIEDHASLGLCRRLGKEHARGMDRDALGRARMKSASTVVLEEGTITPTRRQFVRSSLMRRSRVTKPLIAWALAPGRVAVAN